MEFIKDHLDQTAKIAQSIATQEVDRLISALTELKSSGGRLYFLGVGGSAANAAHAVNDFRKLAGIESYAPSDNIAELTARANDEGWATIFSGWLKVSKLSANDAIFILSVGGGDRERNISANLCEAIDYAKSVGAKVFGIVGRDGGYTRRTADISILIPTIDPTLVTPHSESFQEVIWHLMVSHPKLKENQTKW
jgi:D-sedoheptulose 7-phosphate isomerase